MSDIAKLNHKVMRLEAELLDAKEEIREAKRQIRALFAEHHRVASRLRMDSPQPLDLPSVPNCRCTTDPVLELTPTVPPKPARPDQPTVIEVVVPEGRSKGRIYGPLRYALKITVVEGDAAAKKWTASAANAATWADAVRRFWGQVADRVETMPPGRGTWRWTGISRWNGRGWSLVEGTWTEVTP